MTEVLPGSTIGVLGGGQLARMIALDARRMGYRLAVLDPDPACPAGSLSDHYEQGAFDDLEAARRLAAQADLVTLDTEHIPVELLEALEAVVTLRPAASVLAVVQDRGVQRRFLQANGVPVPRHAAVSDRESLHAAIRGIGVPGVLKSRRAGYDGKGQARIDREEAAEQAWERIGRVPAVLEAFVDFEQEISVVLARDVRGGIRFFPIAENVHVRQILHTTRVPARLPEALAAQAREIGAALASAMGHVGVMAVEMFVTGAGGLLVNEIAPRTHNSGHFTLGACATSQFEQHVRAVCGLPLGDPSLLSPAAMINLLGDLWQAREPDWRAVLSHPKARLHLYGKLRATPGRKMGHILVLDEDPDEALRTAEALLAALEGKGGGIEG